MGQPALIDRIPDAQRSQRRPGRSVEPTGPMGFCSQSTVAQAREVLPGLGAAAPGPSPLIAD